MKGWRSMKKIVSAATAGFMEQNDVLVTVEPSQKGIEVVLTSDVERQYGEHMRDLIRETVKEAGYDNVKVTATDKGAWDYTIIARVLGALQRGGQA